MLHLGIRDFAIIEMPPAEEVLFYRTKLPTPPRYFSRRLPRADILAITLYSALPGRHDFAGCSAIFQPTEVRRRQLPRNAHDHFPATAMPLASCLASVRFRKRADDYGNDDKRKSAVRAIYQGVAVGTGR